MSIKPITTFLSIGAVTAASLVPATLAGASPRPQVDFSGSGTYEMVSFGVFARGAGDGHGRPFDGRATFMLRADDGTFPGPGECEDGGANLAITARHHHLSGVAIGEICGQFVQESTSTVTQVFTGEYSTYESTKRLRDTEGWIEIRLATEDGMSITLFDS